MNFNDALHLCELLMAVAFTQHSVEHCFGAAKVRGIYVPKLLLAVLLMAFIVSDAPSWNVVVVEAGLLLCGLAGLLRFDGAYNGGSDRLGLLMLCCVMAARSAPSMLWSQIALGYLAIQLLLSYFIAGWAKLLNPQWRNGQALRDVFGFSCYPVNEQLRDWQRWPRLLWLASWSVILLELLLPLGLYSADLLFGVLTVAATFHLVNACLFGFNRFLWVWLAAYPAVIWFQGRLM